MTDAPRYQPGPIADLTALAKIMSDLVEQMRPSLTALGQAIAALGPHLDPGTTSEPHRQGRTTKAQRRCAKHLLAHRRRTHPEAPSLGIAQAARQYYTASTHHTITHYTHRKENEYEAGA